MTDNPPPLLTEEEAYTLLSLALNRALDLPYTSPQAQTPHEQLMHRLRRQHELKRARTEAAKRILDEVYGDDLPPEALELVEAGDQWAITRFGVLYLGEPGYRIPARLLFDRNLFGQMVSKDWIDMSEFIACVLYARAYHRDHQPLST